MGITGDAAGNGSTWSIRLATERDAEQVAAIYAPNVTDTIVSFESEPPDAHETRRRIETTLERYPWLVCEHQGRVLGYTYAGAHRSRAAYQWSVDVSAYVYGEAHRKGVGRALYASLFALLRLQGFYNAHARIALPNPASVGLHEAMRFRPVGVYQGVGYKRKLGPSPFGTLRLGWRPRRRITPIDRRPFVVADSSDYEGASPRR